MKTAFATGLFHFGSTSAVAQVQLDEEETGSEG
jgi:hypothetical protein